MYDSSPTQLTRLIVADPVRSPGGSTDSTPYFTQVDGRPVSAALEIRSSSGALLIPRMTQAEIDALSTVADGMMVFNIDDDAFNFRAEQEWIDISTSTGNVTGPIESIIHNVAVFDTTDGESIADGGLNIKQQTEVVLNGNLLGASSGVINTLSNLGYIQFSATLNDLPYGGFYVGSLTPMEFYEKQVGPDNYQVCTLFTSNAPGSGINSSPSALVELNSDSGALLLSRLTTDEISKLIPVNGMLVYNKETNFFLMYQSDAWVTIGIGAPSEGTVQSVMTGTGLTGGPITTTGTISIANTGVTAGSYSIPNITFNAQGQATSAVSATRIIDNSGVHNNLFVGQTAGNLNAYGGYNTGVGSSTLFLLTSGGSNSALGSGALYGTTTGSYNAAIGGNALLGNTGGSSNSAVGWNSGAMQGNNNNCTFLGASSDASNNNLTNSTAVGANTTIAVSNAVNLGNGCKVGINQPSPAYTFHISNVNSNCALKLDDTVSIPASPAAGGGGILYTYGDSLYYANNAQTLNLSAITGTVTSITAGSNLTGGTITSTGTIALNNVITGLTSVQVGSLSLASNIISSTSTNTNITLSPNGTGIVNTLQNVAIGSANAPTKLTLTGTDQNYAAGPHFQTYTSVDSYPLMQFLNWTHNNMSIYFDAYYNGGDISSTSISNFHIWKNSNLNFRYNSGTAPGTAISWQNGFTLTPSGKFGIIDGNPGSTLSVIGNAQIGFGSGTAAPTNGLVVNGNLGVGTSSAATPITVVNNSTSTPLDLAKISSTYSGTGYAQSRMQLLKGTNGGYIAGFNNSSNYGLSLGVMNGSTATEMVSIVNGSVGIGTSNPSGAKLVLSGAYQNVINGPHTLFYTSNDNYPLFEQLNFAHDNISLNFDAYNNGAWVSSSANGSFQILKVANQLNFNYATAAQGSNLPSWTSAMTINTSGGVGINTTNPTTGYVLDVNGFVQIGSGLSIISKSGAGPAYISIQSKTSSDPFVFPASGSSVIQSDSTGKLLHNTLASMYGGTIVTASTSLNCGTIALNGTVGVTISTSSILTNSLVFIQRNVGTNSAPANNNVGILSVSNIVNGTSFKIYSTNASDTYNVNWFIINP